MGEANANPPPEDSESGGTLHFVYDGGLANTGSLLLEDYANSLAGWGALFQISGELYFHSFPQLRKIRGKDLLRIEVIGEKRGSYEVVLAFIFGAAAGGIIGNRADAAAVWTFQKLVAWFRELISVYVQKKTDTTDVQEIAAALRTLLEQNDIPLHLSEKDDQDTLFVSESRQEPDDDEPSEIDRDRARIIAEKLDQALKLATQPLDDSCKKIDVSENAGARVFGFGAAERAVINAPLTLPPPKRDWQSARIRFQRIHEGTGRALFKFEHEIGNDQGSHFSKIIDPLFWKPQNRYMRAFYDGTELDVWIRQTKPEKGHLNTLWEISGNDPAQGELFNLPPLN